MSSLTPFGFIDFTCQIIDQLTTQVNGIITSLVSLSTSLTNHILLLIGLLELILIGQLY